MPNDQRREEPPTEFLPEIRRARFGKLTIYEISESELDILEKGSPNSTYLDFAIGLLSAAIAFSISLATTDINSPKIFAVFVLGVIVGYLIGFLLLLIWWKNRRSVTSVGAVVRSRLPPEGISEHLTSNELEPTKRELGSN